MARKTVAKVKHKKDDWQRQGSITQYTVEKSPFPLKASQVFRFLDLPAELRNAIYELAALLNNKIQLNKTYPLDGWTKQIKPPQITRVNRQIRSESLPVYYAVNSFYINLRLHHSFDIDLLSRFFDHIGCANCKAIRSFENCFASWQYMTIEGLAAWVTLHAERPTRLPRQHAIQFSTPFPRQSYYVWTQGDTSWVNDLMAGLAALGRTLVSEIPLRAFILKRRTMEWIESKDHPEYEAAKEKIRLVYTKKQYRR